ncbi:MAG: hypothetical protein FJY44_01100 [Betaproteobacteria bacterium]|nr:hypothetical protein [Betaproteobacteria bacterium]
MTPKRNRHTTTTPVLMRLVLCALPLLAGACSVAPQRGIEPPPPPAAAEPPATTTATTPPAAESASMPAPLTEIAAAKPTTQPKTADRPDAKAEARIETRAEAKPAPKPPAVQAAAKPAATLDLDTLEQRLRNTAAIGGFTKLALKNQVDDLLDRFRDHYAGRGNATLPQLRQTYEQLIQRVHGLLRDGDPPLATAILQSREAIWAVLTDPVKFARL